MLMHLIPLGGGPVIAIDKPILFFGRGPECDVVLLNSRKVSRKHCCIAQIDDHFVLRDLGSMNGVRVNGQPVSRECRIAAGDEIYIGDVGYRLEVRVPEKKSPQQLHKKGAPAAPVKAPAGRPLRRVDPKFLSQDLAVASPDEAVDFAVEETQRKLRTTKSKHPRDDDNEVLELNDIDIVDD